MKFMDEIGRLKVLVMEVLEREKGGRERKCRRLKKK